MQLSQYLFFNGNCEEAFNFYHKVLGGEIVAMIRHAGSPVEDETPPERLNAIMHARLRLGHFDLMGGDAPPEYYKTPQGFTVALLFDDPIEAERVFIALSENGQIRMPIEETFFSRKFGMLVDQFAMPWMVNCEKPLQ